MDEIDAFQHQLVMANDIYELCYLSITYGEAPVQDPHGVKSSFQGSTDVPHARSSPVPGSFGSCFQPVLRRDMAFDMFSNTTQHTRVVPYNFWCCHNCGGLLDGLHSLQETSQSLAWH